MKKNIRLLVRILIILIFLLIFYNKISFGGTLSNDINNIDENKYPGYKELINKVKKEYPSWNIKLYYTGLDWEEVIMNESQGHLSSPKNLVPATESNYSGAWICPICGLNTFDTDNWYCASDAAIKYMMDPRNSLNSTDIFQFQELSLNGTVDKSIITKMVSGTFLNNEECITAIYDAAVKYKVNPYYIIARIIQEQSKNGSALSLGQGYNGQYIGVYNFFNFGATGNGKDTVILNGLKYAQNCNWTTPRLAILGGVEKIANSYIAIGQNTLYYQKFNVVTSNLYLHQYMQNIMAAQSEGTKLRKTYLEVDPNLSNSYEFIIPVYENMPKTVSPRPDHTSDIILKYDVGVITAEGGLAIRITPNGEMIKQNGNNVYIAKGQQVKILERGTEKIGNYIWYKVVTEDGYYGYMAKGNESKTYIIRTEAEKTTTIKNPFSTGTTTPTPTQGIDYTKVTGNFSENNMIDYGLMVTGDFNGDGVDDVATMYSYGGNLSRILVNTSNKTSLNKEEIWYASNSYDAKRVVGKFVAGDFNGDGKEDIAAMCDYGNNVMKIHVWISTGKQFKEEVAWFSSNQYNAEKISERIVSGDFNGDGKEDIAAMYDYGNLVTRTHVWLSTGEKLKNEEHWFMSNQYIANRINQRIVSGDFNGDGKEDIAAVYDYGNLRVRTHVWLSTGSKFANEEHWFMSNQYIAERITARLTAGDVDGDGKDDLVAMYDYKNANTAIHIWKSTGSKFANEEHWFVSGIGNYIAERVSKVTTGDFNGDGKADIAAIYSYGKPKKSIHLWKSTGKTLNKMEIW